MGASKDITKLVRTIYLQRQDGEVEISHSAGTESLFFRRGELFLDRDHEVAVRLSRVLADLPRDRRLAAVPELRGEVEELARQIARLHEARAELHDGRAMAVETVGPLPTVCFVQELAVFGCSDDELFGLLGGDAVKVRSTDKTPALDQLPGLEAEMAEVLAALEKPTTPADILRAASGDGSGALRGLVKLWAVGLAEPADTSSQLAARARAEEILTPKLLDTFANRIAQSLHENPIDLEPENHRVRLAELLSGLGHMNYYELLGIDLRADDDAVFNAYTALARTVHPGHARRLGLEDRDEALRVLFERATEAYLTLSEPKRKASYNTLAGIHRGVEVDAAQRQQEKRAIARQNYRRAATCLAEMDYSQAVELLKESARLDPQPDYYARLAQAQGKNPNWHHHAVESFRRSLELKPDDAGVHFGFGSLLEEMDRSDEAGQEYQMALELMPDHPDAREGLERLGGLGSRTEKIKARTGDFRSLFGSEASPEEPSE